MKVKKIENGKSNPTTSTFATRLGDLISESDKTMKFLADKIGVPSGSLSKYQNDNAEPGIISLVKIANYFNVSTDYLLGLTEVKTPDVKIKDICKITGLYEAAVKRIATITTVGGQITGAVLNQIITNTGFTDAVYQLSEMFKLKLKRDVSCSIVLRDDWDKLVNGEKCEARHVPSSVIKDIYITRSVKSMEKAINETITQIEGLKLAQDGALEKPIKKAGEDSIMSKRNIEKQSKESE